MVALVRTVAIRLGLSVLVAAMVGTPLRAVAQDTLPEPLRQARLALAAGNVDDAIRQARRYTGDHPRDARGFLALGDAYMRQMPAGRFLAIRASQAYQTSSTVTAPRSSRPSP